MQTLHTYLASIVLQIRAEAGGRGCRASARPRLRFPPVQLVRRPRPSMPDLYDVTECTCEDGASHSTLERRQDMRPADDLESLALCQKLLVRAKTQRSMHPLDSHVGNTKATDLAKAELRIAHAYRKVGSLDQVKVHILAGLKDLSKPEVRNPPLEQRGSDEHRNTLVETLKLLGEICMEEKPPKHRKALTAFTSAVPGLPKFDSVLVGVPDGEGSWCSQGLDAAGTLSDDVSEALMHDLPFAAAVGSCYEHVAAELLRKLQTLQRNRSSMFQKILTQLRCICALEQRLAITLPHPQLVSQRTAAVAQRSGSDAVTEHCNCVLDVLSFASLHSKSVPYWTVASEGAAPAPPSVTHAIAQWRSNVRRTSIMMKKPVEQQQCLPEIGKWHWMITTPMQKLEQLGTQLVLARASKHQTLVVLGTDSVAVYLRQTLETLQEHGFMPVGTVVHVTSDMTFQEKSVAFDRKSSVILATEGQLAGLDLSGCKRIIQYDLTLPLSSLVTRASSHASVTIFMMRHEVLAVNVLQHAGIPLPCQATDLLPLQPDNDSGHILSIEALLRRKGIADVQLREAGAQAFTQYVCWYCSIHSSLITAPSALDAHALRAVFLVPNANDAVSSMAHSFHTRMRSMSATTMDMTLSTLRDNAAGVMANQEDEVAPDILENAVSVMETLAEWEQTRAAHIELESGIKTLLESLSTLDTKLRSIPPHAHAVAEQAVTLLYCVATELANKDSEKAGGMGRLEHKLWHSICEVHYIAGCLLLNDVNKAEGEQLRGCAQQLDQILMTQDYHHDRAVVSRTLESKTLDLYGKCAMGLGELDKAESLFIRLRNLSRGKGSHKGKRQIDRAHAEVLLGDVYALSGKHQQAGESYKAAMAIFRAHLAPQHKHMYHLQERMLALLHKRQNSASGRE